MTAGEVFGGFKCSLVPFNADGSRLLWIRPLQAACGLLAGWCLDFFSGKGASAISGSFPTLFSVLTAKNPSDRVRSSRSAAKPQAPLAAGLGGALGQERLYGQDGSRFWGPASPFPSAWHGQIQPWGAAVLLPVALMANAAPEPSAGCWKRLVESSESVVGLLEQAGRKASPQKEKEN